MRLAAEPPNFLKTRSGATFKAVMVDTSAPDFILTMYLPSTSSAVRGMCRGARAWIEGAASAARGRVARMEAERILGELRVVIKCCLVI